ncbi:hypothetical protein [Oleiharenicola sp. Vm1]|uniref:hypothetical protein n=1 Tax=Oleiharenicola sp. Vm1 TaxID=3398393 RepID=UPI0039F4B513
MLPVIRRRHVVLNLVFIAALTVMFMVPLLLINGLRMERARMRGVSEAEVAAVQAGTSAADGYRMVDRALKHSP